MTAEAETGKAPRVSRWRMALWGLAATLLLLPLVAMQFSDEVAWTGSDFAAFGALLVGAGVGVELAVRESADQAYRAAVAVAITGGFVLVWINGAVGIIGSEDNPANRIYDAVLAVALVGVLVARFRPHGMARALVATALAQVLAAVFAAVAGWGNTFVVTAFFVALWLASAWLFARAAARRAAPAAAAP